ncbi:uncharacterized protein BJ212DRAFT_779757 [Suillus subaureus]|uniref:Uncharacterized protein n=1 Tax=Suillus subaureus TaxID=48587 RepID=A0A9P7J7Y1_9AGAM|nr:uncharacterized protein BJ212DRAFT_779757 [Suillus subaureus]KAG1807032.1 hypothetical protein BJ212DRAFT_779757 [Suillus subaureus]
MSCGISSENPRLAVACPDKAAEHAPPGMRYLCPRTPHVNPPRISPHRLFGQLTRCISSNDGWGYFCRLLVWDPFYLQLLAVHHIPMVFLLTGTEVRIIDPIPGNLLLTRSDCLSSNLQGTARLRAGHPASLASRRANPYWPSSRSSEHQYLVDSMQSSVRFPQCRVPCCSVNPQQLLYLAGPILLTPAEPLSISATAPPFCR